MTLTTSRKCPQCGNEVTPTARFCAECGSSMTPTGLSTPPPSSGSPGFGSPPRDSSMKTGVPPLAPTMRTEPQPDSSQRTIIGVLIGAVVLLSIMVAVLAVTLRHANMASAQPCVPQPSLAPVAPAGEGEAHLPTASTITQPPATPTMPDQSSTTTAPASTTAPAASAAATSTVPAQTPADVAAYLKYLQAVDLKRIALLNGTTPPSDGSSTPDQNGDQASDWQSIIADFQTHTAPDSCSAFASEYLIFLTDCQAASGKPIDPSSPVMGEATRLDGDLGKLCAAEGAVKPFNITMPQPSSTTPTSSTTPPSTTPESPSSGPSQPGQ